MIVAFSVGCGTTKWSDTARTATEQLLLSDAMDRAVSQLDLRALAGKTVFIDETPLATPQKSVVDSTYLVSTIRQHLLASGAILKEKKDEAEYIVEVRAGAVGTDRHDVLFGVPATTIPTVATMPGVPSSIPEIPLMKKTEQQALAKISLFAYNRKSGRPVWQSGVIHAESKAKDFWVFGAGPFQRGSIYEGTEFAPTGGKLDIPLVDLDKKKGAGEPTVSVADEAYFVEPEIKDEPKVAQQPANQVSQTDPQKPAQEGQKPAQPPPGAEKEAVAAVAAPTPATTPAAAPPAAAPQTIAATAPPGRQVSDQAIQVPLINTPPITAPPPEITGPSPPIPGARVTQSAIAGQNSAAVVPLPPITPAPDEQPETAALERLLKTRQ